MNTFKLTVGDHSDDGHSMKESFTVQVNYDSIGIYKAYLTSSRTTGLVFTPSHSFRRGNNIIEYGHPELKDRQICVEYGVDEISDIARRELIDFGIKEEFLTILTPKDFATLLLEFIKVSLPKLEYTFVNPHIKDFPITGIGYGLF